MALPSIHMFKKHDTGSGYAHLLGCMEYAAVALVACCC
jgi:hypothetical protein